MKKRLAASLLLALFLFCIGCRPPEGVAMQSAAAQAGITPGVYVHTAREIEQAYRPRLELYEDGTCAFTVNLLSAMGRLEGLYAVDGDWLTVTVQSLDFTGFAGDDVKELTFELVGPGRLMFRGTDNPDAPYLGATEALFFFKNVVGGGCSAAPNKLRRPRA